MKLDELLKSPLWRVTTGNSQSGVYWASLWRYWPHYDILTYRCQGQGADTESALKDLAELVETIIKD